MSYCLANSAPNESTLFKRPLGTFLSLFQFPGCWNFNNIYLNDNFNFSHFLFVNSTFINSSMYMPKGKKISEAIFLCSKEPTKKKFIISALASKMGPIKKQRHFIISIRTGIFGKYFLLFSHKKKSSEKTSPNYWNNKSLKLFTWTDILHPISRGITM